MIEVADVDGVALVRLEHGRVNALDLEFAGAVGATFRDLAADPPKAAVVTGNGRAFCAGVDLRRVLTEPPGYVEEFLPALAGAFEAVFAFPSPLVAAIDGPAIAGGCVVACAADHRIADASAGTMGLTELAVGVPFPVVALEIVRWCVGTERLRRLALEAEVLEPQNALDAGLADRLVEGGVVEAALEEAGRLGAVPFESTRLVKRQLREPALARIAGGGAVDAKVVAAWQSAEGRGAIAAFAERVLGWTAEGDA